MASARLLIFDSDAKRHPFSVAAMAILEQSDLDVETDATKAAEQPAAEAFDGLVLGIDSKDGKELELLAAGRTNDPSLPAVVVCRKPTAENAVAAMRAGVTEFLTEPIDEEK